MTNTIRIIGIDCATQPTKVGLCAADLCGGELQLLDTFAPRKHDQLVSKISEWFTPTCLLALDAPLGWPRLLATSLTNHRAGDAIPATGNELFSRETDRFIQRTFKKRPLEVGANLIARTALAALALLGEVRAHTDHSLPLPMTPGPQSEPTAIEVYPAATVLALGWSPPKNQDRRSWLGSKLTTALSLTRTQRQQIQDSEHVMDAMICCLAGADFLRGEVHSPSDQELAQREGWIWIRKS